jgi:hypothetical protein
MEYKQMEHDDFVHHEMMLEAKAEKIAVCNFHGINCDNCMCDMKDNICVCGDTLGHKCLHYKKKVG